MLLTRRLAFMAALAVSCRSATDDCAPVGVDGLRLSIRDSATSADLSSSATVTVAQLSAPFETRTGKLTDPPPTPLFVAADRPGRYRVTIAVPNYATWTQEVEVSKSGGRCSVTITTSVAALLLRST